MYLAMLDSRASSMRNRSAGNRHTLSAVYATTDAAWGESATRVIAPNDSPGASRLGSTSRSSFGRSPTDVAASPVSIT